MNFTKLTQHKNSSTQRKAELEKERQNRSRKQCLREKLQKIVRYAL